MNYCFNIGKVLCALALMHIPFSHAGTMAGAKAEQYWASKINRELVSCGKNFDAFFMKQKSLSQDQVKQLEIVYNNTFCYMDKTKPSKRNDVFFAWRLTHDNHDYIQEDIAYDYYKHIIALVNTYIFWEKNFSITQDDALVLESLSLSFFLKKAEALNNPDFIKKYNARSVFGAYQKYIKKEMLKVLSAPYNGADVEMLSLFLFEKYQDNGTVLLYNEKPL